MARKHLKRVAYWVLLSITCFMIFAGATRAFRHGVPLQDIQAQGTWSSQCVWRYIQLPPGVLGAFHPVVHFKTGVLSRWYGLLP